MHLQCYNGKIKVKKIQRQRHKLNQIVKEKKKHTKILLFYYIILFLFEFNYY